MHPQVPSPLNSGRSGGIAAARVAFKALTSPELDVNEGCFRPLHVILPEGTMLSARPPAAPGRWSLALPTVIDTLLQALAPAVPHLIPAAHKGDMGGGAGAANSAIVRRADGSERVVLKATEIELSAGDVVTFLTAGGGGYGDPRERAADAVARDVVDEVVTKAGVK